MAIQYKTQREEGIKAIVLERERIRENYNALLNKASEEIENISDYLQKILTDKEEILCFVKKIRKIEGREEDMVRRVTPGYMPLLPRGYRRKRLKPARKYLDTLIDKDKIRIKNYFANLNGAIKNLRNNVNESERAGFTSYTEEALESIRQFESKTIVIDYKQIPEVISFLESSPQVQDFFSQLQAYESQLKSYNPEIPKSSIERTFKKNVDALLRQPRATVNQEQLSDSEKGALKYAFCKLEKSKTKIETDEDLEHIVNLEEIMGSLKQPTLEELIGLQGKGYLSGDEVEFLAKTEKQKYKPSQIKNVKKKSKKSFKPSEPSLEEHIKPGKIPASTSPQVFEISLSGVNNPGQTFNVKSVFEAYFRSHGIIGQARVVDRKRGKLRVIGVEEDTIREIISRNYEGNYDLTNSISA